MTTYQWLSVFGVPSIIGAVILFFIRFYRAKFEAQRALIKEQKEQNDREFEAIKLGLQAVLCDRLCTSFEFCVRRGYTEKMDRDNWTRMYTQYHNLGANGVMDDYKIRFFALPDKVEYEKEENVHE